MSLVSDTHGQVETRIRNIIRKLVTSECGLDRSEVAVIILGDAGLNFCLNKTEEKNKKILANYGIRIYCVRGNHEERPENLGYELKWDENVQGEVYYDPVNSEIRYFQDGGIYEIEGHRTLVIGGAYSVDKWYRLARAGYRSEEADPKKCGWFKDEQLTHAERAAIASKIWGEDFDFILSHTCPYSWMPTDLFLSDIDQSTVDNSMEEWLDDIKDMCDWGVWCFGHYHADRIERPRAEQFYYDFDSLSVIWNRWQHYNKTGELYCYRQKSPYMQEILK